MATNRLVGRPVGGFSDRPASGSSVVASGDGADFAIGGLSFRMAIGKERPYQRATADFRKEQLDTASDVGDQSLTGWWKRGQLSFHKGAGITYYEVLDGKAVSDRFSASVDVAVDTPGVVTLGASWSAPTGLSGLIYGVSSGDGHSLYLTNSGSVISSVPAGPYFPTSGTANGLARGADDVVYVATSANNIETTTTSLGAGTVAYTHTTTIAQVWYAKGRLWVIDGDSKLYQLAPTVTGPTAIDPVADLVCTFAEPTTAWNAASWLLTESPSAVYVGHASGTVYAVTISSDGSLPTLAAPVEVASLPVGDPLYGLGYYLGSLILQTSSGVRTAQINDDGSVVVGPQFLKVATSAPTQMAGAGNKVWLAADESVISLDLSQLIEDTNLTYAWVTEHEASDLRGVVNDNGALTAYGANGRVVRNAGAHAATGYLTTGQHRFGTLEPKQFHAVRLLVGGPGGRITISRVTSDGAVVTLHTLDVARASEADVGLSMTSPEVSIGLRFDLTQDVSGNAPILYGYQLRALPAPRRQRLVRVPLLLFDVERRRPGLAKGAARQAWQRLAALEAMEESGGTFVYQDFRTGEGGTCFIEKIEMENTTPPGDQDPGFGGIVWLTLRKLN